MADQYLRVVRRPSEVNAQMVVLTSATAQFDVQRHLNQLPRLVAEAALVLELLPQRRNLIPRLPSSGREPLAFARSDPLLHILKGRHARR